MLTDMLCKELGKDDLKLNSKVLSLSYSCDGNSALENWSVACASGRDKHSQTLSVDAVIMTVSAYLLSRMCFSSFMCFIFGKLHSEGFFFFFFNILHRL
jgi:hypothetical protein